MQQFKKLLQESNSKAINLIIEAKWQCFRSTEQTKRQLEAVGFDKIEFVSDKAKVFPTVVAYKKG